MSELSQPLAPELERARYGANRKGDRFVAFWLALLVEGRQSKLRPDPRRVGRTIDHFLNDRDVVAATDALGRTAVDDQLADAAATYFQSCLTDPTYSTLVWGMSRLNADQLRGKAARDAVDTLLMVEAGSDDATAERLARLMVAGYVEVFGEPGEAVLRAEAERRPALASLVSALWRD